MKPGRTCYEEKYEIRKRILIIKQLPTHTDRVSKVSKLIVLNSKNLFKDPSIQLRYQSKFLQRHSFNVEDIFWITKSLRPSYLQSIEKPFIKYTASSVVCLQYSDTLEHCSLKLCNILMIPMR